MQVTTYPKNNHVRLSPYKYRQLADKVFERDGWRCVECGSPRNLTLAHIIHRGQGGGHGPGDVIENCETLCMSCHDKQERHIDGRKKR